MFNDITDLIYKSHQDSQTLDNIEKLLSDFENTKGKNQLHFSKFVQDLKNIMENYNASNK